MIYSTGSGGEFFGYIGDELSQREIEEELKSIIEDNDEERNYDVQIIHDHAYVGDVTKPVLLGKVVYCDDDYMCDREPTCYGDNIAVSGFDDDDIYEYASNEFDEDDNDRTHICILKEYDRSGMSFLDKLPFDCSTVIYDGDEQCLIAGVKEKELDNTELYYGYTKINHEIMYSNSKRLIDRLCDRAREVNDNTILKNGKVYNLDGTLKSPIEDRVVDKEADFLSYDENNAKNLINGINEMLTGFAKEVVGSRVENIIEKRLESDEVKDQITTQVDDLIKDKTKISVDEKIVENIDKYNLDSEIMANLQKKFQEEMEKTTREICKIPVVYIYKKGDEILRASSPGIYHEKFGQILNQIQLDEPIMLIGPAGSGKNHAIAQVANVLGQHMYYTNNASNEFKLTGFIDAGGNYRETEFYKAFKNGGIFFLDEIDNSDPSALIVLNSALANGYMAFPHETIDKNKDFKIVAAANTWGKGADLEYVGRNALDASTLDRFDNIFFDYDRKMEKALYPEQQVLDFMWSFRDAVQDAKISHVVSTRGIGKVYKKDKAGIPVEDTLTSNVVKNLSQDDLNTIIGNMSRVDSSNKYYKGIKNLKLER